MPLDFPSSSSSPWTGSNGVVYTWDGQKWVVSGSGTGPYLLLAGGTMTGPIGLAADPTTDPQAANKHYVDQSINLAGNYLGTWAVASNTPNINAGGSISNANYVATTVVAGTPEVVPVGVPGIAGMTVNNGDRIIWAAGLGVWQILRNAGVTLAAADARYYAITNPSGYQTAANVTTALASYAPLASPPLTGNPTAPTPTYGDNDTSIATTAFVQSAVAPYAGNAGRNLIHNPVMAVAQRGAGAFTGGFQYTLDRWAVALVNDTFSITRGQFIDAARASIGDEAANFYLLNNFTGNATAGSFCQLQQRMEDVRRLAGKTVTVSFWAACVSGTLKLGLNLSQNFGTGGSPSTSTYVLATGAGFTLSTTYTRYSVTFAIPSVAGKTFGTTPGTDFNNLVFWYSAASDLAAPSGNIGVQSGGISLWGVQLEIGSAATPLDYGGTPADQLRQCQRFYNVLIVGLIANAGSASQAFGYAVPVPVTMRASPTTALSNTSFSNTSALNVNFALNSVLSVYANATAAGAASFQATVALSAEL